MHDRDDNGSVGSATRSPPHAQASQTNVSQPPRKPSWLGKPVEEVDALIFDHTFCVISKKMGKHYIYRYASAKSLYLFGPLNPIRKWAIWITTHRWFDVFIILVIGSNCFTLAAISNKFVPKPDGSDADEKQPFWVETFVPTIEYGFLAVYTVEMILKVLAKGFLFHKFAYLRNRWNILDMIVIITGYVAVPLQTLFTDATDGQSATAVNATLDVLKTLRVLRVIKTMSILPGLKLMINTLISSFVQLLEVMGLILICLMIFSLFAVEMFQGVLRQKCVIDKGGPMDPDYLINERLATIVDKNKRDEAWTEWVTDWKNWKRRDFPEDEPTQCGNDSDTRLCGEGYTCLGLTGDNPNDGWLSFDNIFLAMLSCFQLLTADYWERIYDLIVSSVGLWSVVFFIIIIFVGSYYLLNLLLAVVTMSYENESVHLDLNAMSTSERLGLHRKESNFSFDDMTKLNICKLTARKPRTKSEAEKQALIEKYGEKKKDDKGPLDKSIMNLLGVRMGQGQDVDPEESQPLPTVSIGSIHGGNYLGKSLLSVKGSFGSDKSKSSLGSGSTKVVKVGFLEVPPAAVAQSESDVEISVSRSEHPRTSTQSFNILKLKMFKYIASVTQPIVNHRCFDFLITIFIILNTLCLAIEHHNMTKALENWLKVSTYIFMAVFTAECILKLMALQSHYFRSGWNIFDLVILLFSYIDLIVIHALPTTGGISVLRSMRLLRVFKLAHSWVTMKVLLNIIFSSFGNLGNLTLLLMIIVYIFAVMGMQNIGSNYSLKAFDAVKHPLRFPRWNWKHFWYAFMMVFRVLCGEWIEPLGECLQAQSYFVALRKYGTLLTFMTYFKCFAIFLPILVIGNFIVFNLFLAMLLNSFDTEELNAQLEREKAAAGRENVASFIHLMMAQKMREEDEEEDDEEDEDDDEEDHEHEIVVVSKLKQKPPAGASGGLGRQPKSASASQMRIIENKAKKRWKLAIRRIVLNLRIEAAERAIRRAENIIERKNQQIANRLFLKNPGGFGLGRIHHDVTPETSESSGESDFGKDCFPQKLFKFKICARCNTTPIRRKKIRENNLYNKCRAWSVNIVSHASFEYTILTLIFVSSITLCFEDIYLDEDQETKQILCIINIVLAGLFFLEMILKWFAIGIWEYWTSYWTILDGFIVGVSLVSIYYDVTDGACLDVRDTRSSLSNTHSVGALKVLRTLRALRPLRAISRWEGMKIVVNALLHAIPAIFNVFLVCLLIWLIFSIMGVQFFKGKFYRCVDNEGEALDPRVVPNKKVCCKKADTHDYSWMNTISNFDNVLEGYLSLFQVATFEGWMELMASSVDATGIDRQPKMDHRIGYYAFYVVFIIVGSFFALKLFTGVIIDNFNLLKKKYEGNMIELMLTAKQRSYYIALKNLGRKRPIRMIQKPTSKFFQFFYYMALSKKLEVFVLVMIFLNMAAEAFDTIGVNKQEIHILNGAKAFFTVIYFLECCVKLLGLGIFYFTVPWNVYDLILVLASLIDAFLSHNSDLSVVLPMPPTMMRSVRVLRIGRILRTVKAAKGFRKLLFALTISLPALFNIGALLALITFIYAILGMTLFGRAPQKWSMDDVYNFRTFKSSCLVLLRLMTLAGWNEVMDSLTVVKPLCGSYRHLQCGEPGEPDCPNRGFVVAYIVTYMLLTNQIMINLFIAIILENYVEASDEEDIGIVEDDIELFYTRWTRYDPHATQFIKFEYLSDFLHQLNPPLQVPKPNNLAIVAFNLPIVRGNRIHCLEILHALVARVLGHVDDSEHFRKLQHRMEERFNIQFPNRELLDIVSTTRQWKVEWNAACVIQRAWRKYWTRKNLAAHKSQIGQAPSGTRKSWKSLARKSKQSNSRHSGSDTHEHGGYGHRMKPS